MTTSRDAWALRRILATSALDGEVGLIVDPDLKAMAERLASLPLEGRQGAFSELAAGRDDGDELVMAMAAVDPQDVMPAEEPPASESPPAPAEEETADRSKRGPSQADSLLELAAECQLFHSPEGRCFAKLTLASHKEVHPIKSTGFRRWLRSRFYAATKRSPTGEAVAQAVETIDARAAYSGVEEPVFIRVAPGPDNSVVIDLGGPDWRVVQIDSAEWRILDASPVRFIRPRGMLSLPTPVHGGALDSLWSLVNVQEADRVLVLGWLTAAMRSTRTYPVLKLCGEQGAGKSTVGRVLRQLVDPHVCPLRAEPRENRNLMIAATNNWMLAFDNL